MFLFVVYQSDELKERGDINGLLGRKGRKPGESSQ